MCLTPVNAPSPMMAIQCPVSRLRSLPQAIPKAAEIEVCYDRGKSIIRLSFRLLNPLNPLENGAFSNLSFLSSKDFPGIGLMTYIPDYTVF
jgi:hypothetical protein